MCFPFVSIIKPSLGLEKFASENFLSSKRMSKQITMEKKLISWLGVIKLFFSITISVLVCVIAPAEYLSYDNSLLVALLQQKKSLRPLILVLQILYISSVLQLFYITVLGIFVFVYFNVMCTFEVMVVNEKITEFVKNYQRIHNNLEYSCHEDFQEEMFRKLKAISQDIWNYNK